VTNGALLHISRHNSQQYSHSINDWKLGTDSLEADTQTQTHVEMTKAQADHNCRMSSKTEQKQRWITTNQSATTKACDVSISGKIIYLTKCRVNVAI